MKCAFEYHLQMLNQTINFSVDGVRKSLQDIEKKYDEQGFNDHIDMFMNAIKKGHEFFKQFYSKEEMLHKMENPQQVKKLQDDCNKVPLSYTPYNKVENASRTLA
jgi:hypothetical protein